MKRKKKKEDAAVGVAAEEHPEDQDQVSVDPDQTGESETDGGEASSDSIEALQAKVDKLADSLLRAKADYKNLERRGVVERSDAIRFANAELMRSLLEVVDDFERSIAAEEAASDKNAAIEGVKLVYENLLKALTAHGLEKIESLHQPFDPSVHEAMMQQPSDELPPGTVLQELAKGYKLRDRVLRPSRVIVSSPRATESDESDDAPVETPAAGEKDD